MTSRVRSNGPTLAQALGAFAASMVTRGLEDDVRHHTTRAVIDWFGCVVAGGSLPPASSMRSALGVEIRSSPSGTRPDISVDPSGGRRSPARGVDPSARLDPGWALVYPDGATVPPRAAALVNGTAAHTVEADDIFRQGIVHPGAPVIAAALASAQSAGASGDAFVRGVISGYEVATRAGEALGAGHYRLWHTTGTAGTLGAAAACATVLGLERVKASHALATAATMAAGLQAAIKGDSGSKPLHAGRAAEAGVVAALLAREGVTGALDILESPGGFVEAMSSERNWHDALADLGERYNIREITFKNHLCCGHTFAAIDAVLMLRMTHDIAIESVEEIGVATYRTALEVAGSTLAKTANEARFSLPYVVAVALLYGAVRGDAFTDERLRDPRIRGLMGRVRLEVDDSFEAAFPGRRGARVWIRTAGEVLEWSQASRRGDPDSPLTDGELRAKFVELAAPALGPRRASSLLTRLASVGGTDHVWIVPQVHDASPPGGP